MAYSPPYFFVAGTKVQASEIKDNFQEFRNYINRYVAANDSKKAIVNLKTDDLTKGEYYGVVKDHQFTTGECFTQFVNSEIFNRSYMSAHWKLGAMTKTYYQIIPNTGKKIIPEKDCVVLYTVSVSLVGNPNYELDVSSPEGGGLLNELEVYFSENAQSSQIDTLNQYNFEQATYGGSFTEDWRGSNTDDSGLNAFNKVAMRARRWYCVRKSFKLKAGNEYNIGLGLNTRCDKLYVSARNANIEMFYTEIDPLSENT